MAVNIGLPMDGVPNQGWKLYITSLVMVIVAGLFVIARCTTRLISHKLGSDDYTIVTSLAFSIVLSIAIQLAVVNGYGKHKVDLSPEELKTTLRWFFIAQTPYKIVVCLNKSSVILLYMRIFVTRSFQRMGWVALAIVVGWSIAATALTIFQCVPIPASWDKSVDAQCIDKDAFWIAYAILNVVTDVLVLALPIPQVFKLQLKLREKLLLSGIFLLGGFVTIASILRTTAVASSIQNKTDITYNFIPRGVWTLVEANLGIICACLPIMKQPLAHLFPRLFGSTRKHSAYQGDNIDSRNRQYPLDNVSKEPKQNFWKGSINHNATSTSGPDPWPLRDSDEESIIAKSTVRREPEVDSGSFLHIEPNRPITLVRESIRNDRKY